jgi:flagellar hook assembly protein FlgD
VINYIIGNANDVKINIYTISGRLIEELDCGNEYGYAEHEWDGTDRAGGAVSTGIYIYEVSAEVNGKKIKNTGKAIVIR